MKRIWQISDTHGKHEQLIIPEDIDIVIHSGDGGSYKNPDYCEPDLRACLTWLSNLPAPYKVYVPGNHDTAMEASLVKPEEYPDITILIHEFAEVDGIKIFGSPWTPYFGGWAYNAVPHQIEILWESINEDIDILVTHGPVKDILDLCPDGDHAGCPYLRNKVFQIKPKIHQFGHIHLNGGLTETHNGIKFCNAAVLNEQYQIQNSGLILEY